LKHPVVVWYVHNKYVERGKSGTKGGPAILSLVIFLCVYNANITRVCLRIRIEKKVAR
jgi:hypothetical protein